MSPDYQNYSVEDFTQDERFRQWVIQRDPQSEARWAAWLDAHPELAGKVQLARAFLYALEEKNTAFSATELADITANIIEQNTKPVRPLWSIPLLRIAASILVIIGLGYLFVVRQSASSGLNKLAEISPVLVSNYTEEENTAPEPKQLTLQDGSVVTLYANSKLRYPKQFTPKVREVYLTGRAFFNITKNPKKPFWVHADQISTQVLGTSFLVKADGKNANVEVHSGRVSVYTRKDIQAARRSQHNESVGMVLTANQQVAFIEKEDRLVKSIVAQPIVLQKIDSRDYTFEEVPIDRVFKQLEKTYGVSVLYDPVTVKNCFITARLSDESLFEKLNLICRISRATYEIIDGQIIIHSAGCDNK